MLAAVDLNVDALLARGCVVAIPLRWALRDVTTLLKPELDLCQADSNCHHRVIPSCLQSTNEEGYIRDLTVLYFTSSSLCCLFSHHM